MSSRRIVAFALLALLSLAMAGCIASAPPGQGEAQTQVESSWTGAAQNWQATTIVIIFTIMLLLGIGYTISESTNSRELKAWTITEFYQAAFSMVLVFMLIVLFAVMSQLSSSLASSVTQGSTEFSCAVAECQFDIASDYLLKVRDEAALPLAHEELRGAVKEIGASTFKISLVTVDAITMFSGGSIRPYAGRSIIADRHMLLFDYTSRLAASLTAQASFLTILRGTPSGEPNAGPGLVPLLLIAGIVLRSLFFLRKLGGLMIAIAIALFTVYPLMYLLAWSTLPIEINLTGTQIGGIPEGAPDLTFTYPLQTAQACVAFYGTAANPAWSSLQFDNRGPAYCANTCSADADPPTCEANCLAGDWLDAKYVCANMDTDGVAGFECHDSVLASMAEDTTCADALPGESAYATCYNKYSSPFLQERNIATCYYLIASDAASDPYVAQCTDLASGTICPVDTAIDMRVVYEEADGTTWDYATRMWPALVSRNGDALEARGLELDNVRNACYSCAAYNGGEAMRSVPSPSQQDGAAGNVDTVDFGSDDAVDFGGDVEGVGLLIVVAAILPMMNFILTITFVKMLSPMLGGDMDIEGLMKLI